MFDDGLMYVYGGYSQRCADYCDDIWAFDIYLKAWKQVYPAGQLSTLYYEFTTTTVSGKLFYDEVDVPRDTSKNGWAGPGERWKHVAMISEPINRTVGLTTAATQVQFMAVFGGHRLWHGYSLENSELNDWSNYDKRKPGGYLNDLWMYTKELDAQTIAGSTFKKNVGEFLSGLCFVFEFILTYGCSV